METKVFRLTLALYVFGIFSNTQLLPLCAVLTFVVSTLLKNQSSMVCHLTAYTLGYITGVTPFALLGVQQTFLRQVPL